MSLAWTLPEGHGRPGGRAGEACPFSKPAGVTRSARGSQLEAGAPLPPPTHPPDLRGVQLSRVQVHADEGAGQAAFAQRRLGRAQGLHPWWRGRQSCGRWWLIALKGNREAEGGGGGAGGLMRGWAEEGGRGRLRGHDGQSRAGSQNLEWESQDFHHLTFPPKTQKSPHCPSLTSASFLISTCLQVLLGRQDKLWGKAWRRISALTPLGDLGHYYLTSWSLPILICKIREIPAPALLACHEVDTMSQVQSAQRSLNVCCYHRY